MAITSTSVSALSGQKPFKRKFKLTIGGTIMPGTRGKRMSSRKDKTKKSTTRGKKKKR